MIDIGLIAFMWSFFIICNESFPILMKAIKIVFRRSNANVFFLFFLNHFIDINLVDFDKSESRGKKE